MIEQSKGLYPDIDKAGGLDNALQMQLEEIGSSLKIHIARIENKNRFSQVFKAALERLFLFDLWSDGVCLGNGQTDNLKAAAKAIDQWNSTDCSIFELKKKYEFIKIEDRAKAHEENSDVQFAWEHYFESTKKYNTEIREFIKAAYKKKQLKELFPYMSLNRFCFSRCTGFPYTNDIPLVAPAGSDLYQIVDYNQTKVFAEGNAEFIAEKLIEFLPPGCGPAVKGTAKDLNNTQ